MAARGWPGTDGIDGPSAKVRTLGAGEPVSSYGTLGGVVVFLVVAVLTNMAILLGAEFNAETNGPSSSCRASTAPSAGSGSTSGERPRSGGGRRRPDE